MTARSSFPVATAAGAEEATRRLERELGAIDGVDGAAFDFARHEVVAALAPDAAAAEAIRARIASFGWSPSPPLGLGTAEDPAHRRAARIASTRAGVAVLAAFAATVLGALAGPGALAPFLQLFPDLQGWLRGSIAIRPLPALWVLLAITVAALAGSGGDLFAKAGRDARQRVVTRRLLGAIAIGTLVLAAAWGTLMILLGRPAPPLLFGVALWSLAAVLAGNALALARAVRRRNRESSLDPSLRRTLAAAAWKRGKREERSLSLARWWAVIALAAGAISGALWIAADADWSVAVLAATAVFLAAAPAAFIAAATLPVRTAIEALGTNGVAILGGATLDRARSVRTVATNIRGGVCESRARIAEVMLLQGTTVESLLGAAAAASGRHPLGDLIRERAGSQAQERAHAVIGTIEEMERRGIPTAGITEEVSRFESEGKSVLAVAEDNRLLGTVTIAFDERPGAAETVSWLNGQNIRTVLLTRHPDGTAGALAARFGFTASAGSVERPLDSPLLSGNDGAARAWISERERSAPEGADLSIAFAPDAGPAGEEDAVVTSGSFGALRLLFEAADQAERSAAWRTRWLLAYHLLALPIAGGALLPLTGLLPSPFLAAVGSLVTLALASRK